MSTTDDYVALIAPEHADKPKFVAKIAVSVGPLANLQALFQSFTAAFDLDTAIGVQLDVLGVEVGRSRLLPYPLQGLFFSWDDPDRGWDKGIWKGPFDTGVGIYQLNDDDYRRLLRAIILANAWDGTMPGAQAVLDAYFTDPETLVFIEDNGIAYPNLFFSWDDPARGWDVGVWQTSEDAMNTLPLSMEMTIGVAGKLPSLIDLGLLAQGAFPIKPVGVSIDYRVTSVDNTPVFGFDMDNDYVGGWDTGAWGVEPSFIAAHTV